MILSYLGSKKSLIKYLQFVLDPLIESCGGVKSCVFGDLFCGTSIVASTFQNKVRHMIASDMELYAYIIGKALLQTTYTTKISSIISFLNSKSLPLSKGLVWKNFTPCNPPKFNRLFFTCENGIVIDSIRKFISFLFLKKKITYKEFLFLLASLLSSASKYSNTSGTFRAYLKQLSSKAARKFELEPIHKNSELYGKHTVIKNDAIRVASTSKFDIVYLDPPYNTAHYGAYYSFLNYLSIYRNIKLSGVGITKFYNKSTFGFTKHAEEAFKTLLRNLDSRYIILSYNENAVVPFHTMKQILLTKGSIIVYKIKYRNYRPNKNTKKQFIKEFIFMVDCSCKELMFKECWLKI